MNSPAEENLGHGGGHLGQGRSVEQQWIFWRRIASAKLAASASASFGRFRPNNLAERKIEVGRIEKDRDNEGQANRFSLETH